MRTSSKIIQTTVVLLVLATSAMCQNSWDLNANYSATSNPNGAWSYGGKSSMTATAIDVFPDRWGSCGWYYGNQAGSPSIECGPQMWAQNNGNGYPCFRWTCPMSGEYSIAGAFVANDSRGVDNSVYVVTNGSVMYSGLINTYPQSVGFTNEFVSLKQGNTVDFTLAWDGGVNEQYGWTIVDAVITQVIGPPWSATANAQIVNGFVVGATVTFEGYGYTNTPLVRFIGGGGSGASATAVEYQRDRHYP